ncbi:hemolysin family protein [Arcticibacterium luteifluviistationis]|uniref:Hemolysin n=1 Tax=Arcticibacterium luteifluviistationis TaxID=1784714 RepID=A0A2Z4GD25_9BACT|nr:hemolysin family protein [Arcticibacterium luteifluviistationis]AWV98988.1 hemolysin [Arcticibacterium luteifluviistationis]
MEIVILLILILINGVFSMSEIALISSRRTKLEIASKNGDKRAEAALSLASSPNKFLSTVQIGITLISIFTGIYSGDRLGAYVLPLLQKIPVLAPYADTIAIVIITILVTFLSLILGELVPKRIGLASPEKISMVMAAPMMALSRITSPFIWLLSKTSKFLFSLTGIKESDNSITEEEIKSMAREGATGGSIEEIEHELLQNVFHLGDRKITSLMTNNNEVTFLDLDDTPNENKKKIIASRHSVYPVCNDGINNMVGLLYVKDLLGKSLTTELKSLESNLRECLFIPENNLGYQVLEKFQQERRHFGVIVDEYGNVQGVVTMNDILDALVGDISETNEFEFEIFKREDGTFLIDASLPFDEFLQEFEVEINNRKDYQGFDTMGGFALEILQEIPDTGDHFVWENFRFEIVDMDKNRVDKILVTLLDEKE